MWSYFWIGILGLAGGLILLTMVKSLIETIVFMRSASKTSGKVIRLATTRNSDGHTLYLPVFEYRTNDGTIYQYTSTVASKPPAYNIGETATLFYQKKNPRNAKINSFSELWLVKTIFTIIGLACFGGAVLIFLNVK